MQLKTKKKFTYHNRDISWLAFNHRVLLEATNHNIPLYERIKFLAIYHSNLDEFFRVRVAWLKRISEFQQKEERKFGYHPDYLLEKVFTIVEDHISTLDHYFYNFILPELSENGINVLSNEQLSLQQKNFVNEFSKSHILPFIQPSLLEKGKIISFLKNRSIYLGIELKDKQTGGIKYAFVEIPTWKTTRFIELPNTGQSTDYILLDDAIRFLLPSIFPGYKIISVNSFMVTRDAELYIEDELSGNLVEKIKANLMKRESGYAIGFIFDRSMPIKMLKYLIQTFEIDPESVIVGSKYLKMSDFMKLPNPAGSSLENERWGRLKHRNFEKYDSLFDAIKAKDRLLSFPYQKFDYVTELLDSASKDKKVTEINVSLYRTSERSKIARLLINAARRGKKVTAFVEVKARFDEESNIIWAEEMRSHGVDIIYSVPEIKVHSKLILIARSENGTIRNYALISTGNFNRNTAKLYCDHAYITARKQVTNEVKQVFDMFKNHLSELLPFQHLMVAPHQMRTKIEEYIDFEIEQAKKGKRAEIMIKVNSLEDRKIINQLYRASNAGVKIRLVVRGICCLVAGVKGQSENIEVRSIIDRYLEHARILRFYHKGKDLIYMGSADMMRRNLSRRIEVMTPIYEEDVKKQLIKVLELQWKDNVKARWIDADLSDKRVDIATKRVQSQLEIHNYFKTLMSSKSNR